MSKRGTLTISPGAAGSQSHAFISLCHRFIARGSQNTKTSSPEGALSAEGGDVGLRRSRGPGCVSPCSTPAPPASRGTQRGLFTG